MRKTRKSRACYFRFARFNTSALYYLRAWHGLAPWRMIKYSLSLLPLPLPFLFLPRKLYCVNERAQSSVSGRATKLSERKVSLSNENIDDLALKTRISVFQRPVKREALQTRLSTHHVIKRVYYPRSIKLAGNLIL